MALLPIQITEPNRRRLSTLLWIVHWICAICGLTVISIGVYIRIRIRDKVNLIEGYDGKALPLMLIIVGGITTVIDLVGGKLCERIADLSQREKLKSFLLPYLLVFLVLNVCIFVAGCMCFSHRFHLHESFDRGLVKAMEQYKNNETVKYEINQLQIDFECCGNNGYEDWFAVQWIGIEYLSNDLAGTMTGGQYLNDDAPYSCCKSGMLRPCIHHHVHDNDRHYNYDYREGLTLYQRGCKHALMDYFTTRLNRIGSIILVVFVLKSVIFIVLRYLQTSIENAYKEDDPEGTAPGWLLENIPYFTKQPDAVKEEDKEPIYENIR
ncbi:photoreceptor outer segment membrane glycoprotein 2-like [Acanthaster planci]|uniref:Photoreceptor outer segment membrane glycoprotein 2-like n=1 Tax=Acanthaster planci TaxID=133434 RepID=A0A8B7XNL9_ACAPL|nr:photoreceptor outer segment membrane glycoprotein 2-like [Acanthaster planci]